MTLLAKKYILLIKREVKTAVYWSFFAFLSNINPLFIVEVHLALKLIHGHSTLKQTPNWQEANQLAIIFTSAAEERIQLVVRAGLELGISRFQVRHPDHSKKKRKENSPNTQLS